MKLIITDQTDLPLKVEGEHFIIRPGEQPIHPCTGCFGCWVKTPGRCVIRDGYEDTGILMSRCDRLILISRCCYGAPSPFVKAVQDRAISYVQPDFVLYKGELHHKRRYGNTFTLSACFYGAELTDREKETARDIIRANAENDHGVFGEVRFFAAPEEIGEVVL